MFQGLGTGGEVDVELGPDPRYKLIRDDRRPKNGCFFWKTSKRPCPPPPRPFLENTLRFFPENPLSMRKFAMIFFGLAMAPPLSPPFWKLYCAFFPKYTALKPTKSAM